MSVYTTPSAEHCNVAITQQCHDVTMTFSNFERAGLLSNPTPSESVYDPPVLSHLIHDLAWHSGDQRSQQGLWNVLEAGLYHQFNRAARSECIPPGVWSMSCNT